MGGGKEAGGFILGARSSAWVMPGDQNAVLEAGSIKRKAAKKGGALKKPPT